MARHFVPSIARTKERARRLQKQTMKPHREMSQEVICWYWPGSLKAKETHTRYLLKRTSEMDPDLIYEKVNAVIPGVTVKEDPALPFFVVLIPEPLTPREFVSKMRRVLEGLI